MNRIFFLIFLLFTSCLSGLPASPKIVKSGYNKFVKNPYSHTIAVVPFDSDEGIALFNQSNFKKAFFKLAPHYSPQQDIASCGIASSVILLNTIYANNGKRPPMSVSGSWFVPEENTIYGQFTWTEENFYNYKIRDLLDRAVVEGDRKVKDRYDLGVTLNKLTHVLKRQGLKAKCYHAKSAHSEDIESFRTLVKQLMADPKKYIVVNYNLNAYLAESGGHFSPIAAYEECGDYVLILDTWAASNVWIWIKLPDLYKSMHTLDGDHYRGYILVQSKCE